MRLGFYSGSGYIDRRIGRISVLGGRCVALASHTLNKQEVYSITKSAMVDFTISDRVLLVFIALSKPARNRNRGLNNVGDTTDLINSCDLQKSKIFNNHSFVTV